MLKCDILPLAGGDKTLFALSRRINKTPTFEIDSPKILITLDASGIETLLKNSGADYTVITKGYITFRGYVFNSDFPLMIGIHFNDLQVKFIEIFRPDEYYQSEKFNISASFNELSALLKKKYGNPRVTTSKSINDYPCEQWMTSDYFINHNIADHFGPAEYLHINFYKN